MRKSRFTGQEIVGAVKQIEAGVSVKELARKYGVSLKTLYTWRRKYAGLAPNELARLTQLEKENRKLKASSLTTRSRPFAHVVPLAFPAPDIVARILAGTQPVDLTAQKLTKQIDLRLDGVERRSPLGFA